MDPPALDLDALRAVLRAAEEQGRPVVALVLHPTTPVHVADPALGLPPLTAMEMDAVDGLPVVADELVPPGAVEVREG